jgi:predicted TIM-barrel fold metal-dependent hydrolase
MRQIYEMAATYKVPVTIHFQMVPHSPTEGTFTTGFERFPAILRQYSNTTFFGHADYFWANISAEVPNDVAYPTGKIKPGGLTDQMLSEYPNLYGDLSANSGRNALARDPDFIKAFLDRHQDKLLFGCDCSCRDGHGAGQMSQEPLIKGKCVARETLAALKQLSTPTVFRKITWENGTKVLKISGAGF